MSDPAPPNDIGRLSRLLVWLGAAARLSVCGCFPLMAGWSWMGHEPAAHIAAPMVLAFGFAVMALALVRRAFD